MKYFILSIVILLSSCKETGNGNNLEYIKFTHTGMTNRIINPLYISTKPLNIKLNDREIADLNKVLRHTGKIITQKNSENYINFYYSLVVTDEKMLSAVYNFILTHRNYYTEDKQQDSSNNESYIIDIPGKEFRLYYKVKDDFFS